jgi:hypothetical protein
MRPPSSQKRLWARKYQTASWSFLATIGCMVIVSVADLTVGTKNMSALGHYQTFRIAIAMSALPPKADIHGRDRVVGYGHNRK